MKAHARLTRVVTAAIIHVRTHTHLYNLNNFPITQQRGGVRTYRTCVSSARAERDYPVTQLQSQCTGHIFSFMNDPAARTCRMHPERLLRFSFFRRIVILSRSRESVCVRWAHDSLRICLCIQSQTAFIRSLTATTGPFVRGLCSLYAWLVICYHLINIARRTIPVALYWDTRNAFCDCLHSFLWNTVKSTQVITQEQ